MPFMHKVKYTDRELMNLFRSGTAQAEKAFSYLVSEYSKSIYWHVRRMTRNHELTNDILQNTWINVWRAVDNFDGRSSLYTWIYRIARNETINYLKKEKRHLSVELDQPLMEVYAGDATLNKYTPEEITAHLMGAIETLPDKQALVFELKYFEELKYSEISGMLGTSEGALKASYSIAVQKIQKYLQDI